MSRLRPTPIAALVTLAVACATEPDPRPFEATDTTASAIQGGTVDTKNNYAVGVCGTNTIAGECVLQCSGVLIAPNLVATARHCVDNVPGTMIDCTSSAFGAPIGPTSSFWITTDYVMTQTTTGWHQVQQIVRTPGTAFCGNDLALLVLADDVAATEASPAIPEVQYPMSDPTLFSGTETAIGYGLTAPNTATQGIRHVKENIGIVCIPASPADPCATQSSIAENEFAAGDGPCDGDSGSGAFEQNNFNNGAAVTFGVLSRGGVMGNLCSGSVYTRFDRWHDLIVQTATMAASLGKYPVPSWTAPVPATDAGLDDGAADGEGSCEDGDACGAPPPRSGGGCSTAAAAATGGAGPGSSWRGAALAVAVLARRRRRSRGTSRKRAVLAPLALLALLGCRMQGNDEARPDPVPVTSAAPLATTAPPATAAPKPASPGITEGSWNAAQIDWQTYEGGLARAASEHKPVCLVMYTTWCPHCRNYSHVFEDPRVVERASKFVMVRIDADAESTIATKFATDGAYIPRTYFLASNGTADTSIHVPRPQYQYFYDERDPSSLLAGMDAALKKLGK